MNFFRVNSDFSDILEPVFMSVFSWAIATICGTMLMIQMEIVEYISTCVLNNN